MEVNNVSMTDDVSRAQCLYLFEERLVDIMSEVIFRKDSTLRPSWQNEIRDFVLLSECDRPRHKNGTWNILMRRRE